MSSKSPGALRVALGLASRTGTRPDNQDFVLAYDGEANERRSHGITAALADGVGGAKGGRIAAEIVCRGFIDAFYGLPETLGVANAAERALVSMNSWLHGMAAAAPEMTGASTTFSAVILRDRFAHLLHVGDSRIWHLRDGRLNQLTTDHVSTRADGREVLLRAVGMEPTVRIDHLAVPIEAHDRLLITSDGVHGVLKTAALEALTSQRGAPDGDVEAIVEAAIRSGSTDNASAILIEVVTVPAPEYGAFAALAADLPVLPAPSTGQSVDGFQLERLLAGGETTRTFLARGGPKGQERYILRFPKPRTTPDPIARDRYVRELLVGTRALSPFVAEVMPLLPGQQSQIYTVMPFYEGTTLEDLLKSGPLAYEIGLSYAANLLRAVAALHRIGVVHRDIKPENILITSDGGLRLIDFGAVRLPAIGDLPGAATPGSQGYIAPEIYAGDAGTPASDLFAVGVTLYRIFTNRFPYSDLQSLRRPGFDSPVEPAKLRRDMPAWLDYTMRRSVQARPEDRFEDAFELLYVLETGSSKGTPRPAKLPLASRNPVLLWQLIALCLAIALVATLVFR
jgi:serine/threonine protein kinase/serine/threonine protein phosphatase PrpC